MMIITAVGRDDTSTDQQEPLAAPSANSRHSSCSRSAASTRSALRRSLCSCTSIPFVGALIRLSPCLAIVALAETEEYRFFG